MARINHYYLESQRDGLKYKVTDEWATVIGYIEREEKRHCWTWRDTIYPNRTGQTFRSAIQTLQSVLGAEHKFFEMLHSTRPLRF